MMATNRYNLKLLLVIIISVSLAFLLLKGDIILKDILIVTYLNFISIPIILLIGKFPKIYLISIGICCLLVIFLFPLFLWGYFNDFNCNSIYSNNPFFVEKEYCRYEKDVREVISSLNSRTYVFTPYYTMVFSPWEYSENGTILNLLYPQGANPLVRSKIEELYNSILLGNCKKIENLTNFFGINYIITPKDKLKNCTFSEVQYKNITLYTFNNSIIECSNSFSYKIGEKEILINTKNSTCKIKISYFPMLKAFDNGKEIQIKDLNPGMEVSGSNIRIVPSLTNINLLGFFITLTSSILFIFL